jgi:hypothetical protein
MDRNELKQCIAALLHLGHSLTEIQYLLRRDHATTLTFLDLRLLASEVEDVNWGKSTAEEAAEAEAADDPDVITEPAEVDTGTVVEVSKLARPGAALSGSVRFASGATADWVLDSYGRLALENATGKPTPEDLREFQEELQRKLGGMA